MLLVVSPIYLGDTTSQFHAFVERLHFCTLSYDDYSSYFTGGLNVGVIFTMNVPQAYCRLQYKRKLSAQAEAFRSLGGKVQTLCRFDTLRVRDYSWFSMVGYDAEHKHAYHEKQFPLDLEKARQMGKGLVRLANGKIKRGSPGRANMRRAGGSFASYEIYAMERPN